MRSNEAPEKIWVHESSAKELDVPLKEYHVEYTRTDAFIEKVCEWLKKNAGKHIYFDECDHEWYDTEELIEDFKNYMKGE